MTQSVAGASRSLEEVRQLRSRTRRDRSNHWFALVVFGMITLGAMPFYVQGAAPMLGACSHVIRPHVVQCGPNPTVNFIPGAFGPNSGAGPTELWSTLYWAVAVVVGFGLVAFYAAYRSAARGVEGRVWPAVTSGIGLFVLVLFTNGGGKHYPAIPDFWVRGLGALCVIAVGLGVLAVLDRSLPFGVFALAFFSLALLSNLYDDVNLLQRVGLDGRFQGSANALPNLILPGVFLLLGGLGFWWADRRAGSKA